MWEGVWYMWEGGYFSKNWLVLKWIFCWEIDVQAKGRLNCDEKPQGYLGESLNCVPLYMLLIGCSDGLSYCVPWAPSVSRKPHTTRDVPDPDTSIR